MNDQEIEQRLLELCSRDGEWWKSDCGKRLTRAVTSIVECEDTETAIEIVEGVFWTAAEEYGGG